MNKHLLTWIGTILALALFGASAPARGELVVIVNPQIGVDQLTRSQVINIFLGNHREFPDGSRALPFDLPTGNPEKTMFYRNLVNKDMNQMTAYWSRLVFAGSTSPPAQAATVQEVIETVAANRGAIAYVERQSIQKSERVRIVFNLPEK
ncbi:MAG: substrate-binding domain-containing protein [Candidatus Accumulibacter sp.]|jgi:ABC-type phosphate transport system substrate-binding protein|nr:substrate-binding domain-containing protein [Accumulibacter sp.]